VVSKRQINNKEKIRKRRVEDEERERAGMGWLCTGIPESN
jgi:hypothetical protein